MTAQFDGKVVIVTGAGGSIGRAAALGFAAEGAKVVVSDIRRETAAEIAGRGAQPSAGGRTEGGTGARGS